MRRNRQGVIGPVAAVAAVAAAVLGPAPAAVTPAPSPVADPRHLSNGRPIPGGRYCDQPYIVKTRDGAWLCVMTSAEGPEGSSTQNVFSMRSLDQGRTWSAAQPLEPRGGPEASYAVLLGTPGGRIYCFYNHNTDNVREVKREDQGVYTRVDSLGHYVFRYTDDGGRSWSPRRYEVPIREFECDRKNIYGGKLRFFWNVGRPLSHAGAAFLPHHKVGAMGAGFFAQSEGCILRSDNLLSETDPEKIHWRTLPDGDIGLRTPTGGGRVAEEQSLSVLSDGSLFCVYRSVDGHPVHAYSRDDGRTWTPPEYLTYAPGGRRVKHPRAANFAWRCENGRFLYWYHNHGGSLVRKQAGWDPYSDRNPAWLAAGREVDTPSGKRIAWSQPEILLYDDDPFVRMSYPDLVEDGGRYYVTETQKHVGRVHEIDPTLLAGLFAQGEAASVSGKGLLVEVAGRGEAALPRLPALHQRDTASPEHAGKDLRGGLTLECWIRPDRVQPGTLLASNREAGGPGFELVTSEQGRVRLLLSDGREESTWLSDPDTLREGRLTHLVAVVDGGPKLILFVVDGVLQDGGEHRQFGWGRYSRTLRDLNGSRQFRLAGSVGRARVYGRALRVSEAVAAFRAGEGAGVKPSR